MTRDQRRQVEEWRPVAAVAGIEVSSEGRVRSVRSRRPLILATHPNRDGYPRVRLWRDNAPYSRFVHALVAEAFIGPRPVGLEVRHLNDDKDDNRASNVTYGTRSQNILDAVRNGKQHQAAKTHCPQDHPYDAANTMVRPNGWRTCRTCQSDRQKASWGRSA